MDFLILYKGGFQTFFKTGDPLFKSYLKVYIQFVFNGIPEDILKVNPLKHIPWE